MEEHSLEEIRTTKHTVKNNVFIKLFEDVRNVYKLYQELHPEDINVKQSDIEIHSMDSMLINDIYNDLGFLVKEEDEFKFVILVEAQSKWTENLTLRLLLYLAETYRHYNYEHKISVHSEKRVKIPKPELYVVYTGNKDVPDVISFKDDYFDGDCCVDVKVKVLKQTSTETVSGQYIGFSKVYDEQRKIYHNKIECIKETIRICKEKGYLVEFLTEHEEEVVTMLMYLFNEQQERETYEAARDKEKIEEGIEIGEKKGIEIGEKKGRAEGIEIGEKQGKLATLAGLVKKGFLTLAQAAQEAKMTEIEFKNTPEMKNA